MDYDLAVIGVGGIGSAALLAGARRGLTTVGLEQFGAAHNRGSSHGQTRIIRAAYYEHPDYVPLALRAFSMWRTIEMELGVQLLNPCGLLQVGLPGSDVIAGVEASARTHRLDVETLTPAGVESRWPWWRVPDDHVGLFEPGAGFLRVENCVAAMIRLARDAGAGFLPTAAVTGWSLDESGQIEIVSGRQRIRARRAVLACGSWSGSLVGAALPRLEILRKQQNWFRVDSDRVQVGNGGVCWLVDEGGAGCFYGIPAIDRQGMKIAEHSGGQVVGSPDEMDRNCNPEDVRRAERFMDRWFRFDRRELSNSSVCMYTMSPDQHFMIDRLPGMPQVVFAAGMSGHGFKFAPVLGEELVALALGEAAADSRFLSLERFSKNAATGS